MKLDDYDTHRILEPNANDGLVWVALGLSQSMPTSLFNAAQSISSITFNQLSRIFLEHQLFDVLIYNFDPRQEKALDIPPNREWLRSLQSDKTVQTVSRIPHELRMYSLMIL